MFNFISNYLNYNLSNQSPVGSIIGQTDNEAQRRDEISLRSSARRKHTHMNANAMIFFLIDNSVIYREVNASFSNQLARNSLWNV